MSRAGTPFRPDPHVTDAAAVALQTARELWNWRRADPADGCPDGGLWSGSCGPCKPRVQATSKGITVLLLTRAAYDIDVAWHTFFALRGSYKDAPLLLPNQPVPVRPEGCPPNPTHEHEPPVTFTWARLTRMHFDDLAGVVEPVQLDLFNTDERRVA